MNDDIRAVIFDSDGTLVDSEVPGLDVLHEMACAHGLSLSRAQAHAQFRGVRMADIVGWIGAQLPVRADAADDFATDFTRRYRAAITRRFEAELAPMPGAVDLLARLALPFGVASNGPRAKVELTLRLTGLLPYVGERIFSAYDDGMFKPDPALFVHAARALGQPARHCAVVEDSIPGLQAGLAAGMQVFSLHRRGGLPDEIAQRVIFIDSLADLADHF